MIGKTPTTPKTPASLPKSQKPKIEVLDKLYTKNVAQNLVKPTLRSMASPLRLDMQTVDAFCWRQTPRKRCVATFWRPKARSSSSSLLTLTLQTETSRPSGLDVPNFSKTKFKGSVLPPRCRHQVLKAVPVACKKWCPSSDGTKTPRQCLPLAKDGVIHQCHQRSRQCLPHAKEGATHPMAPKPLHPKSVPLPCRH